MHCRVAVLCKRRIMLTGTPLQNDLQELQNLLGFLLPDIFREEDAAQLSGVQVRASWIWCHGILTPQARQRDCRFSKAMPAEWATANEIAKIIKEKTAAAWLTHILRSDSVLIAKSFPVNSNARHLQFSLCGMHRDLGVARK